MWGELSDRTLCSGSASLTRARSFPPFFSFPRVMADDHTRDSEAMTVFAVIIAGLFPLITSGGSGLVYWILPYPNERNLWPNFQSPLVFDIIGHIDLPHRERPFLVHRA